MCFLGQDLALEIVGEIDASSVTACAILCSFINGCNLFVFDENAARCYRVRKNEDNPTLLMSGSVTVVKEI